MADCLPSPKRRSSKVESNRVIAQWTATCANKATSEELLLKFDQGRASRVLILPALFDEANKLRRFTVEMMRRLDAMGIDSFLPDLPGCNESLQPLSEQTLSTWRENAKSVATQVSATHVLSVRAGAMLAEVDLPGWRYAPLIGAKQLRSMQRAQKLADREGNLGAEQTKTDNDATNGLVVLNGWTLGAEMIETLSSDPLPERPQQREIAQSELAGAGLWLRAEPSEDHAQSLALAEIIAKEVGDR